MAVRVPGLRHGLVDTGVAAGLRSARRRAHRPRRYCQRRSRGRQGRSRWFLSAAQRARRRRRCRRSRSDLRAWWSVAAAADLTPRESRSPSARFSPMTPCSRRPGANSGGSHGRAVRQQHMSAAYTRPGARADRVGACVDVQVRTRPPPPQITSHARNPRAFHRQPSPRPTVRGARICAQAPGRLRHSFIYYDGTT